MPTEPPAYPGSRLRQQGLTAAHRSCVLRIDFEAVALQGCRRGVGHVDGAHTATIRNAQTPDRPIQWIQQEHAARTARTIRSSCCRRAVLGARRTVGRLAEFRDQTGKGRICYSKGDLQLLETFPRLCLYGRWKGPFEPYLSPSSAGCFLCCKLFRSGTNSSSTVGIAGGSGRAADCRKRAGTPSRSCTKHLFLLFLGSDRGSRHPRGQPTNDAHFS